MNNRFDIGKGPYRIDDSMNKILEYFKYKYIYSFALYVYKYIHSFYVYFRYNIIDYVLCCIQHKFSSHPYLYCPRHPKFNIIKNNHNVLWSPERSGNHWARFIVEYLTGQPTHGCGPNKRDIPICMNQFSDNHKPLAHVNKNAAYVLYKEHLTYRLTNGSTLILLIRDFHEYVSVVQRLSYLYSDTAYYLMYLSLVEAYHKFPGTKILIYYEDLMLEPEREILRLKNFFGTSESRYRDFINHLDYYIKMSKGAKNRDWNGSNSKKNFYYHRNKLSKETMTRRLAHFHELLNEPRFQDIMRPYIARYMQ